MAETEIKKINGRTLADETAREMAKNADGVVKYTAQTLTDSQKAQARTNIGAGTSSFSGSYNDLTNKPAIPSVDWNQVTTGTNITLADRTEYRLTDVTTLTISYSTGNFECWLRLTFADSGDITVTLPESQYIGSTPTFANGETWELSPSDSSEDDFETLKSQLNQIMEVYSE